MKGVIASVLVVLAIMVQVMVEPIEAFTCGELAMKVMPCAPYVTGSAVQPSPECCNGVKTLKSMMVTKDDTREMCKCLKAAASAYPSIKDEAIAALPDKCGAPLPFTISKNMNCDKINP
ncbi:Non-specific lipid-transfer protein [Thalictrum thalictroides]|uniref:Non-specific lipid-transfer protein n=1 Tax=Thalictrum thalictroides TaxID=46969 RepID=A0A7J6WME2_THATH|nr:Non-specific lipid-transfer protein [Thalictrum thalictroides]